MNCTNWYVEQINMTMKSPRRYISKKGLVLTTELSSMVGTKQLSCHLQHTKYESASNISVTQGTHKQGGEAEPHSFSTLQH